MPLVCVVEDDEIVRQIIVNLLEMEGYETQEASNGQEALQLLKECESPPCLILLDLMMPVMDGAEFRKRQLQDPDIASVPVVVVTGKGSLGNSEPLGRLTVVNKPFKFDEIRNVVSQYCPIM